MVVDEADHHFARRSGSACAKYADAIFRISLARRRKNLDLVPESDLRAVGRQRGLEFLVLIRDEAEQVRERRLVVFASAYSPLGQDNSASPR